ncbi:MAG: proteasome assembly chaperone family protein [Acidimicrobiales bacterium]
MTVPSSLYRLTGEPAPPSPVLVVALDGWVDAGLAGATAMTSLLEAVETRPYAVFDSEELLDQRARRPKLKIVDGINEELDWPQVTLSVGADRLGSGVAMLAGPEPDMRWQSFSDAVAEIATALGVPLLVGFGGFPAGAPHTRPVKLAATASDGQLAQQIGFISGSIDVPAGIQAAIERACSNVGIPSVGLWARVPHYVAAMPFPAASVALLNGLAILSGLVIDSHLLAEAAEAARKKIDELIAQSSEHQAMVRQLEQQIDELEGTPAVLDDRTVPSGDEIAAELERYLRGR